MQNDATDLYARTRAELKREVGYSGLFYTPEDLESHIQKYVSTLPQGHRATGYLIAYGVVNYYAEYIANFADAFSHQRGGQND